MFAAHPAVALAAGANPVCRPSVDQLWADLQDLFRRTKTDFDPTTPEARAAWAAQQAGLASPPRPARRRSATRRPAAAVAR